MILDQSGRPQYEFALNVVEAGTASEKGARGNCFVAEIGTDIILDPSILDTHHHEGWKRVHYDLLVACAAVEFLDRRCRRRVGRRSRSFQVNLPVLEPDAWQQPQVQEGLQGTLNYLTGDDWRFSFNPASGLPGNHHYQRMFPLICNKQFIIAYSDGLDSHCVSGMFDKDNSAVRVRLIKSKYPIKASEQPFDQIPFIVRVESPQEFSLQSRGFKFAAIAGIAAQISSLTRIIVPESGQGALGPVLLSLHNMYPDYRNHPTFFRMMEGFIEALLGYSVIYEQPRLWHTKGETIREYLAQSEMRRESVLNTRSCWQQRWNARLNGKLKQCGLCAACLLRRMSLHAADVDEPADTYVFGDLRAPSYEDAIPQAGGLRRSSSMLEYGIVGARHLQRLAAMAKCTETELRPHVFQIAEAIGSPEQKASRALRELLLNHAREWRDFKCAQGPQSFVKSWTERRRHG